MTGISGLDFTKGPGTPGVSDYTFGDPPPQLSPTKTPSSETDLFVLAQDPVRPLHAREEIIDWQRLIVDRIASEGHSNTVSAYRIALNRAIEDHPGFRLSETERNELEARQESLNQANARIQTQLNANLQEYVLAMWQAAFFPRDGGNRLRSIQIQRENLIQTLANQRRAVAQLQRFIDGHND